jgi:2-aminoethylphosphonate-pyruvate transaminase
MNKDKQISNWKQKALFTPGPLTTSLTVKQAMLRDVGSRDIEFITTLSDIRNGILEITGNDNNKFATIIVQGSGTYAIEAVLTTASPQNALWLVIENGAYGGRITSILDRLKIDKIVLKYPENTIPDLDEITRILQDNAAITHVAIIHSETTTGIVNPVESVGEIVKDFGKIYFVDAMSSFGAIPVDLNKGSIDYLACCANKNFEGVPGFGFVVAKKEVLEQTKGNARSLVLDLYDQWKGFEKDGQFRFTPPTHSIMAFKQALLELKQEGGIKARAARYRENYETLVDGMRNLGFTEYLDPKLQGYVIVSFYYPDHPNFKFDEFYQNLNDKGYVIYPGKLSNADCFRIGTCGRLFKTDMQDLLNAIKETLQEMEIKL